jgi:predicted AAA+ superfamily ATPase
MVIGARQVGKTYTLGEFCRGEFRESLYFNLFDRADVVNIFAENINTQDKIRKLELLVGEKIDFENTVLFFDEVQQSEELIEALKYFAESEARYKIVCAGSLLGVKLKRFSRSFPVGKVSMLHMFPMDFEEFMEAMGESGLVSEIRYCYASDRSLSGPLHDRCMELFRTYLCIGGMPEAVADIVRVCGDVLLADRGIQKNIYRSYLNDMSKYVISPEERLKIESVYHSIPAQAENQSRKFQYAKVTKGARSRNYESALSWLIASGMVYRCESVTLPEAPLRGFADPDVFKLYLNDPGILCSLLDVSFPDIMLDREFLFKGALAESYVAGQFAALEIPLFYWRDGNKAEVDLLLSGAGGVVPVEVKAGENKRSASLRSFVNRYAPSVSIRVAARNFGLYGGIKSVPLYAAFCLGE